METVLITIHLMVVIALVIVVLLQRSEGGALGMGGGGGFMTGRGQANALTRATAILAAIFFLTSISLTILANIGRSQKSIFEGGPAKPSQSAPAVPGQKPAPAPTPPGGSLFEQLKRQSEGKPAAPAGGGAPTAPAAPTVPAAPSAPPAAPPSPPANPAAPPAPAPAR